MKQLRSLGQVFLTDTGCIRKISDSMDIKGRPVLEIGPGNGVLSGFLAERAANLYCVEIDRRFCDFLIKKFRNRSNVKIIHADILRFPISKLGKKIIVFGNLPYQISSRLIRHLIAYRKHIQSAYVTVQKEFFEKMAARPSGDGYGFLSCYVQYYLKAERIFNIDPAAFSPRPKVDSTFARLSFYRRPKYKVINEDLLFRVIRGAFSSRRKKITNALRLSDKNRIFLESKGVNPSLRPEELALKDYVVIANRLYGGLYRKDSF